MLISPTVITDINVVSILDLGTRNSILPLALYGGQKDSILGLGQRAGAKEYVKWHARRSTQAAGVK